MLQYIALMYQLTYLKININYYFQIINRITASQEYQLLQNKTIYQALFVPKQCSTFKNKL